MEHTNISQNNQNHPSTWKIFKIYQKIKSIFKKWRSIRWYHEILRNTKCILLYIKMSKHSTWSDTAQYHTEAIKSVPATEKHEKGVSHKFESKPYETRFSIFWFHTRNSEQNNSIYNIWYLGHTRNCDRFWSGYKTINKNFRQMFRTVGKFDRFSTYGIFDKA